MLTPETEVELRHAVKLVQDRFVKYSPRRALVFQGLANGDNAREIAEQLNLSRNYVDHTIKTHMNRMPPWLKLYVMDVLHQAEAEHDIPCVELDAPRHVRLEE